MAEAQAERPVAPAVAGKVLLRRGQQAWAGREEGQGALAAVATVWAASARPVRVGAAEGAVAYFQTLGLGFPLGAAAHS